MEGIVFPSPPTASDIEWMYAMRRDMQEIIPGLFLGPYAAANRSQLSRLQEVGITHIVCVKQPCEDHFIRPNFPTHFRYLVLNIADGLTENIIRYFQQVKSFVDDCLASDGKVLIHGNSGISRSAALVIAYVMEKFGLSYIEAFQFVQRKRFCICPNEAFAQQLMEYEPMYKARLQISASALSSPNSAHELSSHKRKFEDDDNDDGDDNCMC